MYCKKWEYPLLLAIIFILILTTETNGYDFRNVNWGMAKEQVKINEQSDLFSEKEDYLYYTVNLNNYFFLLEYLFQENKLIRSKYILLDTFVIKNKYIDILEEFKEEIINNYGNSFNEVMIWKNDFYKDQPDKYGTAVMLNYLSYYYKWNTDETLIWLLLNGDGKASITLGMQFISQEHIQEYIDFEKKNE